MSLSWGGAQGQMARPNRALGARSRAQPRPSRLNVTERITAGNEVCNQVIAAICCKG